jgi:hypothetical protein
MTQWWSPSAGAFRVADIDARILAASARRVPTSTATAATP